MFYKYLNDKNFLKQLDEYPHKSLYVRIFILNFQTEEAIAAIEGKTLSGNVNLSGTSNMRRTASFSIAVDPNGIDFLNGQSIPYNKITKVENLISLNKKVKIEVGYSNPFVSWGEGYYQEYETIWIPLGLFVIKNASISKNAQGAVISMNLNDKCALLNGDMGGTFPAATILSEIETYRLDGNKVEVEQILIKDIIRHIVINFGGEKIENIIIEDIPETALKVLQWGDTDIDAYFQKDEEGEVIGIITTGADSNKIAFGDLVGYDIVPFVYPGTLECDAGDTVASVLDKIKNTLGGNYEWFYDINGKFHFREKKNFLNHSVTSEQIQMAETAIQEKDYLLLSTLAETVYTFEGGNNLTSISFNPQFSNIKNDFVVWGKTRTASGVEKPIRYHTVFQSKPTVDERERWVIVYPDEKNLFQIIPIEMGKNCFRLSKQITENYSSLNNKKHYYLKKKYKNKE